MLLHCISLMLASSCISNDSHIFFFPFFIPTQANSHHLMLQEVPNCSSQFHIFLPGNEIPRWFRFRNIGGSVTMRAPRLDNLLFVQSYDSLVVWTDSTRRFDVNYYGEKTIINSASPSLVSQPLSLITFGWPICRGGLLKHSVFGDLQRLPSTSFTWVKNFGTLL